MFPVGGMKQSVRSRDTVRFYLAVRRLTGFIGGATGRVRVECVLSPPSLVNVTTRASLFLFHSLSLSLSSLHVSHARLLPIFFFVRASTYLPGWLVGWLVGWLLTYPILYLLLAYRRSLNRSTYIPRDFRRKNVPLSTRGFCVLYYSFQRSDFCSIWRSSLTPLILENEN